MIVGLEAEHARRVQVLGQRGKLPRVAVGRSFVFPVTALVEFVRQGTSIGGRAGRKAAGEE
jgi:hypothetical protein